MCCIFSLLLEGKDSAMQDKKEEKPAKPPKEYEVEAIVDYVKDEAVCYAGVYTSKTEN